MKIITVRDIDKFAETIIPTPSKASKKKIESILLDVKKNGDKAVLKYAKKFDSPGLKLSNIKVTKKEIDAAVKKVGRPFMKALNKV